MVKKNNWGSKKMNKGSSGTKVLEKLLRKRFQTGTLDGISYVELHKSNPLFIQYDHQAFVGQCTRIKKALAKGALSEDEDDMEPDPTGGLGDANEDEEDTTVTSVADDTSTNPPPARRARYSSRVPPRGGTSGRNNNANQHYCIKTNEGTVICPFIFYKYEEVTPIRREVHVCWKVACVSGTDAQGYEVRLSNDRKSIDVYFMTNASRKLFYMADPIFLEDNPSQAHLTASEQVHAHVTRNFTEIPAHRMNLFAYGDKLERIEYQGMKFANFPRTINEHPAEGKLEVLVIRALVQGYDIERKITPSSAHVHLSNAVQNMLDGSDTPITPSQHVQGASTSQNQTNGGGNATGGGSRRPFTRSASRRAAAAAGARGTTTTKPSVSSANYGGMHGDKRKGARHGPSVHDESDEDASMASMMSSMSSKITELFSDFAKKPFAKKPDPKKPDPKKPDTISIDSAKIKEVIQGEVMKKLDSHEIGDEIEKKFLGVLSMLDNKVQDVTKELIQKTLRNEMQQFMQSLQTQHQMAQQIQQEQQQNHPSSTGQDPYSYHMQGGEYSGHMNQQGTPQHPIYHLDSFRGGVETPVPNTIECDDSKYSF